MWVIGDRWHFNALQKQGKGASHAAFGIVQMAVRRGRWAERSRLGGGIVRPVLDDVATGFYPVGFQGKDDGITMPSLQITSRGGGSGPSDPKRERRDRAPSGKRRRSLCGVFSPEVSRSPVRNGREGPRPPPLNRKCGRRAPSRRCVKSSQPVGATERPSPILCCEKRPSLPGQTAITHNNAERT